MSNTPLFLSKLDDLLAMLKCKNISPVRVYIQCDMPTKKYNNITVIVNWRDDVKRFDYLSINVQKDFEEIIKLLEKYYRVKEAKYYANYEEEIAEIYIHLVR